MRLYLAIALLCCSCSCQDEPHEVRISKGCVTDQNFRAETKQCLVDCTNAGNPQRKMGEEENLHRIVESCASACEQIYCAAQYQFYNGLGWYECRKGLAPEYIRACIDAGWKP